MELDHGACDVANLSWDDLRLFKAAYEHRSLTGAADALGLGQATLSRRIAALEVEVGHLLFDRTRRGLEPTPAAIALSPHVEAMAASADQASTALQGLEEQPEGTVRIAVPEGLAVDIVVPLLPELARRHPKVRLEVLSEMRLVDLTRREADLALRGRRPEGGDLLARRLPDVPTGLYASAALVDRLPPDATLADVPLLQYSADLGQLPYARWVDDRLAGQPAAFVSNSFLALRAAAVAGIGAMLLPAPQAQIAHLVRVPVAIPEIPTIPWFLIVPRPLRQVPRIAAVVELVEDAVKDGLASGRWPPPEFAR